MFEDVLKTVELLAQMLAIIVSILTIANLTR